MILSGQVRLQASLHEVALATRQIATHHIQPSDCVDENLGEQDSSIVQLSKQSSPVQETTLAQCKGNATVDNGLDQGHHKTQAEYGAEATPEVIECSWNLGHYNDPRTGCGSFEYNLQTNNILSFLLVLCLIWTRSQSVRPNILATYKKKLPTTVILTYYLPSWFFARAVNAFLSFDMMGDPYGSPYMSTQIARVRPDASKIFHLAAAGDIEGMKAMFARGLASPNDVSYTFGFSVLHVSKTTSDGPLI